MTVFIPYLGRQSHRTAPFFLREFSTGRPFRPVLLSGVKFYRDSTENPSRDYSGFGILFSNLLVIGYALHQGWTLGEMMGIYWAQSVLIGFFHFFRILLLKSFSTDGFTSNGEPVPETAKGKRMTAIFFAVHFGFFHIVYLVFLLGFGHEAEGPATGSSAEVGGSGSFWFLISVLGFFLGHAFSFYENVKADLKNRPNLGTMMFLPYARIIPMHLTIIFGNQVDSKSFSMILFTGLKTAADYLMHIVEHRVLQKKAKDA